MTWFLKSAKREERAPEALNRLVPTRIEQFVAAAGKTQFADNAYGARGRIDRRIIDDIVQAAGGIEAFKPADFDTAQRDLGRGRQSWQQAFDTMKVDAKLDLIFEQAESIAAADPERWGRLPVDRDQFEATARDIGNARYQEYQDVLNAGSSPVAQVAGTIAGAFTDPVNIALMPLGGSPARLGQFVLREALIGGVAEAAIAPRAQAQAEAFDLPDVDIAERVAVGVAGGAAIGAIIGGGVRAVDYLRTRRQAEAAARPANTPGTDHAAAINREETRLREGDEPTLDAAPTRPDPTLPALEDPVVANALDLIGGLEAPQGFDQPSGFTRIAPPRPLTQMTVNDVLEWQAANAAAGAESTAAGRFQIIRKTLQGLRDEMGLTGGEVFDEAMQRRMAVTLMQRRGLDDWRAGKITDTQFANRLAQEWAALPMVDGPRAGRSYYSDGLNASLTSPDAVLSVLRGGAPPARSGGGAAPDSFPAAGGRAITRYNEVVSPTGMRAQVRYEVLDIDDLNFASGDLQPRDRAGRLSSDEQIAEIAAGLDPARLMPSPEADRGAPIIGPDRMIESGNGRVAAIARAADLHPERYDAYVNAIREGGFIIPEGVRRPVLAAVRETEFDAPQRRDWVTGNNDRATMSMGTAEQAARDRDFLSQSAFDAYRPGEAMEAPANDEFRRRVLQAMPQAERSGMSTREGAMTNAGFDRIRRALFARAFDAMDLLERLTETGDRRLRGLLNMLQDLAPDWAAFRAGIDAGLIQSEFDITDQLVDVVRTIARARTEARDGQGVVAAIRDRMANGDMFKGGSDDLNGQILAAFYRGDVARPAEATEAILRRYIAEAQIAGRADIGDLLGSPSPVDTLARAIDLHEARAPMTPAAATTVTIPDIRAVDPARTADGAASPLLTRVADQREAELRGRITPDAASRQGRGSDAMPERQTVDAQEASAVQAARAEFRGLDDLTLEWGAPGSGVEMSVADVLDDLARDADMADIVKICTTSGGRA
ncbi:hypothetical protein ACVDG3_18315 [Meridianimarinicoccus sp. RP-17]|uniref:hypothetical protein n=1 Tax=Meridianimarinicoccus zhengii TaxID=2056810 RepID=UPI000DACD35F|nr:hypothetical protein [Phycocomes zhengii]